MSQLPTSLEKNKMDEKTINDAYLVNPGAGRGVLVLHPWWGLNGFIKGYCDRLAAQGFTVLAPDLYHGQVAVTIEEATALRDGLQNETCARDILGGLAALRSACGQASPALGLVGFSLGGGWGLWLASQNRVSAAVIFYASYPLDFSQSKAAYQFHLAETDPYETAEDVAATLAALKTAGCETESFTYPGTTHWFFESDRPDAYNPAAANLAWTRSLAFLQRHVGK
jgi:carboxymethylenebutenolidase